MKLSCEPLQFDGSITNVRLDSVIIGTIHCLSIGGRLHYYGRKAGPVLITGNSFPDYQDAVTDVLDFHMGREGKQVRFYGSHLPESIPNEARRKAQVVLASAPSCSIVPYWHKMPPIRTIDGDGG